MTLLVDRAIPFASAEIPQYMLPIGQLELVRTRAQSGAFAELESLLWFRENEDDWRQEKTLMRAYQEYAEAMMISAATLREKMAIIRNYPPEKMVYWISNGVGFDTMQRANELAQIAKKTPAQLLDEAVELGGANGKTMTADELTCHALGEVKRDPAFFRVNALLSRLERLPVLMQWEAGKREKFASWVEAGREFFE
jgi:hypothetical protein